MALREQQTAAARIVFIDRATDASISALRADFGYHPLDLESALSIPVESSFSSYATYAYLTLLWPDPIQGETYDLRIFVDGQRLVLIGDTPHGTIQKMFEALVQTSDERHLHSPAELVHDLLRTLVAASESADTVSRVAAQRYADASVVIRQYARWLQQRGPAAIVPALIIDAHRIDTQADRCRATVPVTVEATPTSAVAGPQLLGAYAVASAVMVVIVLVTLSTH